MGDKMKAINVEVDSAVAIITVGPHWDINQLRESIRDNITVRSFENGKKNLVIDMRDVDIRVTKTFIIQLKNLLQKAYGVGDRCVIVLNNNEESKRGNAIISLVMPHTHSLFQMSITTDYEEAKNTAKG